MLNSFKNLGLPAQLVITVFLAAGLVFCGYKFFPNIQQMGQTIQKQEKKLQDLNEEITKGINLEKRLPELEREIANLESQLEELKAIIPSVRDDSRLLQQLESIAKRSRLEISRLQAQRLREKEFYDEYPLLVDVTGNYHDLAKFFDRMAHLPRIYNVSGVKITQAKRTDLAIDASFTAVTFIYRDRPTPPPEDAKDKKKKRRGRGARS